MAPRKAMAQHDTHDHPGGVAQPTVSEPMDSVTASLVEAVVQVCRITIVGGSCGSLSLSCSRLPRLRALFVALSPCE